MAESTQAKGEKVDRCVADLTDRGYSEDEAYPICKDAIEGDADTAADALADAIISNATPVSDSEFAPADLDLTTVATDVLVRAQANGTVIWVSEDGAVAYKADIPDRYLEETELTEGDFVPNADVAAAAQDAIDYVDENGLPNPDNQQEGITRAHQLVDHHEQDEPLAYDYWEEISNFHARHRAQDNHECDEPEYDPCMADPGVFSDHTWGSDAGLEQAEGIVDAVGDIESEAEAWGAEMFYVRPAPNSDVDYNGDLLGVGVDFPESDVYVDWKRDAFPDQLEDPHVSIYGSVQDLKQATGNEVEYVDSIESEAAFEWKGDPMANGHDLDPETGKGTCSQTGKTIEAETWGDLAEDCPHCGEALSHVDADDVGEKADGAGDQLSMKGPATALADSPESPADITKEGTNEIDLEALPEEYQAALEADDFVIYGKASIEQWDDDDMPTLIEMDALEGALDRFFESDQAPGIISRYHQDIPVGKPVREHELNEETTIQLSTPEDDPEMHTFEAGETLRTHVADGDGDGRPELWLVSNLANDTEPAKRARLLALQGDLDGYSVTIHRNRDELTDEGRRVTKCDLHAVTLGTGEQIKNSGSTFDVAEFKASLRGTVDLAEDKISAIGRAVSSALY